MGEKITLKITKREVLGKKVKTLRRQGITPGVVYGAGMEAVPIQAEAGEVLRVYKLAGKHTPVQLLGSERRIAMIKDVEPYPTRSNALRHISFHAVRADEPVIAEVPIRLSGTGESEAERAGLVVLQALEKIKVKALPMDLPEALEAPTDGLVKEGDHVPAGEIVFPDSLQIETDLAKAIQASRDLLLAVPSHCFGEILDQIRPHLRPDSRIVWATKGLERNTGRLLEEVIKETLGNTYPLAVLSGPTFAKELASGLPTAITLASDNEEFAREFQARIHCSKHFRVYINDDMLGVQLGGAIKNVIAIGAGISDGMGFGANARTALITRGIAEISRLGTALGANPNTFMGMSGLGDLVLTCTDNQSRNRRFGIMLGQGFSAQTAMDNIGQVVEGFYNTKEAHLLAQRYGVEMPITEQIYQVLFCGKNAKEAAVNLLGRERKEE